MTLELLERSTSDALQREMRRQEYLRQHLSASSDHIHEECIAIIVDDSPSLDGNL